MAGTIVNGTIATGISIFDPTMNPVSITSTGAIIGASVGVFAQLGISGTLVNDGIVSATSYGVRFLSSGTVTNGSTLNTAGVLRFSPWVPGG